VPGCGSFSARAFRGADYPLDVVGTARDFRAAIASAEYDLLIIDLGLPDGDGLALIRELREAEIRPRFS
jgi:DNA-binding response OmpR family regulator